MTTLLQDVRFGIRLLLRSPGFTAVAVATLALGIGANTAIFSVVNALLLQPLPYPEPDRLVMVWQDLRARGGPAEEWATPGSFADWRNAKLFNGVAAVQGWQPALTGSGEPEPLVGEQVTREYFEVLGIQPAVGRTFRAEEDVPNAPRVVILGDGLWQRRFNRDPAVVGRTITLGGEAHEIIGVMPASFRPAVISSAELWRPRRLNLTNPSRGAFVLRVVARLAPHMTLAEASPSVAVLAAQLAAAHPDSNTGVGINLVSLHAQAVGDIRQGLLVLLGAVAFVLLIACANIANLLLARAAGRGREIAVRLALGAGRGRLVRQLLTESALLSLAGGVVGVIAGVWAIDALLSIAPQGAQRMPAVRLDATVLVFALVLTVATGVLFGLVPALHAVRTSVTRALKAGGRGTAGPAGHRTRRALIVLEIATALVLLVGSGLLLRTLLRLQSFDLGFNPDRVLVAGVLPPRVKYERPEQLVAFYDRLLERVAALPGVEAAALTSIVPLGGDSDMTAYIEGRPLPKTAAESIAFWYRLVSADYFKAMEIPLKRGRNFTPGDAAPSIIISEATARRYWPDEDPLGKRVRFSDDAKAPWFTIIGVAGEVRMRGARGERRSEVYLPYWQFPEGGTNVALKASSRPEQLIAPLRQALHEIDPDIPLSNIATMRTIVADSIDQPRFFAVLIAIFAGLAVALAVVGIYGVIAYTVAQRTAEIGVRMALGAGRHDVFALVVGEGLRLTAGGVALGLIGAAGASVAIRTLLFGVTPLDPPTFALTTAALFAAALAACLVPAYRAARVEPVTALRTE
jgi:putative ABC transport system permease protein